MSGATGDPVKNGKLPGFRRCWHAASSAPSGNWVSAWPAVSRIGSAGFGVSGVPVAARSGEFRSGRGRTGPHRTPSTRCRCRCIRTGRACKLTGWPMTVPNLSLDETPVPGLQGNVRQLCPYHHKLVTAHSITERQAPREIDRRRVRWLRRHRALRRGQSGCRPPFRVCAVHENLSRSRSPPP